MRFPSFLILFLLTFFGLSGQVASTTIPDTLRVGYAGSAPFIIQGENQESVEGIVFDIWKEIASSVDQPYQLLPLHSIDEGISKLTNGEMDVVIGPITINSARAAKIDFSQPYYGTELALLAPTVDLTVWDRIKPFFSTTFLFAILGLVFTLFFVGFLFWLVEGRHYPEDYPKEPIKCIGIGAWLAVVTMTTVGYGDYAPKTPKGRVVIGSWMIISLILATTFVAGIATTFAQVNQGEQTITSLNQLGGKRVAVPSNQKVVRLIDAVEAKAVKVDNASQAYAMLLNGEVDAVVYDEVQLEYTLEASERENYQLTKKDLVPQRYGFMFSKESQMGRLIDQKIIEMRESKEVQKIVTKWIQKG